jgi:dolichol-phosphate mannosyltransferase
MKLSVITPTFNEAENVSRLVKELKSALEGIDYEILVVDDNSPDRTWAVAEGLASSDPRVRVLRRMSNPGLTPAVIDGFRAARGDAVACIDADLQHDPAVLPRMLKEISNGCDLAVGSRYVDGGDARQWNIIRRVESWIATKMAQILLGVELKDPMSGYFMLRRKDFAAIQAQLSGKGFKVLLEILAKMRSIVVREVPYSFRSRTAGQSKLSHKVVVQYLAQVWRLSSLRRQFSLGFIKLRHWASSGSS